MPSKLLKPEQIRFHPCQQGHQMAEIAADNAFGDAVRAFDGGIGAVNNPLRANPESDDSRDPYEFHLPTILRG